MINIGLAVKNREEVNELITKLLSMQNIINVTRGENK